MGRYDALWLREWGCGQWLFLNLDVSWRVSPRLPGVHGGPGEGDGGPTWICSLFQDEVPLRTIGRDAELTPKSKGVCCFWTLNNWHFWGTSMVVVGTGPEVCPYGLVHACPHPGKPPTLGRAAAGFSRDNTLGPQRLLERGDNLDLSESPEEEHLAQLRSQAPPSQPGGCAESHSLRIRGREGGRAGPELSLGMCTFLVWEDNDNIPSLGAAPVVTQVLRSCCGSGPSTRRTGVYLWNLNYPFVCQETQV